MQKRFCILYIKHHRDVKYSLIMSNNRITFYNVIIEWMGSAHALCEKALCLLLVMEDRTHKQCVTYLQLLKVMR